MERLQKGILIHKSIPESSRRILFPMRDGWKERVRNCTGLKQKKEKDYKPERCNCSLWQRVVRRTLESSWKKKEFASGLVEKVN